MRCPNCGAKFPQNANICIHCGTMMSQLVTASNKEVTRARKEYQPELIVNSSIFPSDLSYKKTLLLCIFLGHFGAHRYYTKQTLSAVIMTVLWSLMLIVSFFVGLHWAHYLNLYELGFSADAINGIFGVVSFCGAGIIIKWAFDLIYLIIRKYKVPVVLGKKEEKGK